MAMTVSYLTVQGEILSETRNGVESDYIPDPLGSIANLLNSSHTITDTFSWWPYGEQRSHTGSSSTPFGFTGTLGCYTDSAGSRIYERARVYQPQTTVWQTVDPLWPFARLKFVYVDSRPITYSDRMGDCPPNLNLLCKLECRTLLNSNWKHWKYQCTVFEHRIYSACGDYYGTFYTNYSCTCTGAVPRIHPVKKPKCTTLCILICGIINVLGTTSKLPPPFNNLDFGPDNCEGTCERAARLAGLCD